MTMFLNKTLPSRLINKTAIKLFGILALGLVLNACGEDKPSQPKTETPAKAAETKTLETKTDAAKPAEEAKTSAANTNEKPSDATEQKQAAEQKAEDKAAKEVDSKKADDKKSDVKALSIEEGKKRYETTCKACHEQGLLDAPKLTDKANWAKRLEQGVDTLHAHSAKGFNKMPAQAAGDVSEAEVYAAVDYMVSQVK